MRTSDQHFPGAARPPRRFMVMGLAIGLVALWVSTAGAQQPDGCRYIAHSPVHAEGFDGQSTFGAKLVPKSDRWRWGPAPAAAILACPSCAPPEIAKAVIRIGLAPFYTPSDEYALRRDTGQQSASLTEFALHPSAIAIGMQAMTNFTPREIVPESDITPITQFGIPAMARAIRINSAGNPIYGVALALQDRCFMLFAMIFREDNAPLAVSELQQLDDAFALEKYQPRFNLEQLTPRALPPPRVPFPLGDARKQMEEERKRQ